MHYDCYSTNLFLYKMISLLTYLSDKVKNVYITGLVYSFHHAVNDNVCSTSTNTRTEMKSITHSVWIKAAQCSLTLSLPRVLSSKLRGKSWISFHKIVKNKQHYMTVLLNSLHLKGHTLGFHPQTQKVQPHILTHDLNLGVKRFIIRHDTQKWVKFYTVYHLGLQLAAMNPRISWYHCYNSITAYYWVHNLLSMLLTCSGQ